MSAEHWILLAIQASFRLQRLAQVNSCCVRQRPLYTTKCDTTSTADLIDGSTISCCIQIHPDWTCPLHWYFDMKSFVSHHPSSLTALHKLVDEALIHSRTANHHIHASQDLALSIPNLQAEFGYCLCRIWHLGYIAWTFVSSRQSKPFQSYGVMHGTMTMSSSDWRICGNHSCSNRKCSQVRHPKDVTRYSQTGVACGDLLRSCEFMTKDSNAISSCTSCKDCTFALPESFLSPGEQNKGECSA